MTNEHSAGENIDAWCTKCKSELVHRIFAMVDDIPKKVICNTCKGKHNYRTKPPEKKAPKSNKTARKTKHQETDYNEYVSRLTGLDPSDANKYSMKGSFKKDEIIDHPKFGLGIVLSVIQAHKIEILFKEGSKLLVQNQ